MLYTRQEGNTIPCLSISLAFMKPGIRAIFFSQKWSVIFQSNLTIGIQQSRTTISLQLFSHTSNCERILCTFSLQRACRKETSHDHKFLNIQACGINLTYILNLRDVWPPESCFSFAAANLWSHCLSDTNPQEILYKYKSTWENTVSQMWFGSCRLTSSNGLLSVGKSSL